MQKDTHGETDTSAHPDACPDTCVPEPRAIARFHAAIDAVAGKWKIEILCVLLDGTLRFGDLRRALPGVTQHTLTAQLRDLEANGLLTRTVHAQVPPRVEYELTAASLALLPMFRALHDWADRHGEALLARRARPKPPRRNAAAARRAPDTAGTRRPD
ncbi:winged helix-turn-helix transcriptional regulator [Burkholderia perseverans]|uniref:winged helix-turn-helix transcriptional regulator n=1 Tax=Burkholderia perseverans TaxID=2615214 RepID=UPI001FEFE1FA|nr:helix-turn-helix domain-containing protein [Burkholderia perseverans]